LPYIEDLLQRIETGQGEEEFIPLLERMSQHLSKAYCAFAPGAAGPVESLLTYFKDEVREHIAEFPARFGPVRIEHLHSTVVSW